MTRDRWSNAELEQLDKQIIDALRLSRPQSVRHVFYLMTDPRLPRPVEKTEKGYKRVQRQCVALRRQKRVPYNWIVDTTRRGYHTLTYDGPAAMVRTHARHYRVDPWATTDRVVEVWSESRSIAGVLEATCREYAVSLYPSAGFASLSLAYSAAEDAVERAAGRPVEIVYVGDYDPAGVLIDEAIMSELHEHLQNDLALHRIAITEEQIAAYDLPTKPRKKTEKRKPEMDKTVEAEAMPVGVLLGLLRGQLDAFLPEGALQEARQSEERVRKALTKLADLIDEGENGLSEVIDSRLLMKALRDQSDDDNGT